MSETPRPAEWRPDERTLGLLLFGFSIVSGATALIFANSDFAVLFNVPPQGAVAGVTYQYTVAEQMDAAGAFVQGCAAVVAALGAAGIYAAKRWGGPVAVIALAVQVLALVVSMVAVPGGALVIGRLIETAWLVVLILLITGMRRMAQQGRAESAALPAERTGSPDEEASVTTEETVSVDGD